MRGHKMAAQKKKPVKTPAKQKAAQQQSHVLIAEDSAVQAVLLAKILTAAGYRVDVAKDGLEALAFLAKDQPDIVISDVEMPNMDGIELCTRIKNDTKLQHLPVILVTAMSGAEDVLRGLSAGANNYVVKPYDEAYLLSRVEHELSKDGGIVRASEGRAVDVDIEGRQYHVDVPPAQIVKMLMTTYETAMNQNSQLINTQVELNGLNRALEGKVLEANASAEELRNSEERFRAAVQLIPDIIYRIDMNGAFTFLNDAISMLGYQPKDLIGKHFTTIIEIEKTALQDREEMLAEYAGRKTGDEKAPKLFDERRTGLRATRGMEIRLKTKGNKKKKHGEIFRIIGEVNAAGLRLEHEDCEELVGTVGAIRDVTERKKMEEKLNELNLNLENKIEERTQALFTANHELESTLAELERSHEGVIQSEKLAALGTLVAGVAHDLNNPLMGGLNYIQYVQKHESSEKLKAYLEKAEREVDRASKIVLNMLSYSRKSAEECSMVSIADVIVAVRELVDASLRQTEIEFIINLPKKSLKVWAKFDSLQQVFLNLITNAIHAVKEEPAREITVVEAQSTKGFICVEIRDTGQGMSKDELRRIFDPFFTTKAVGKGTGLGLSVSKNIVEGFGGSIRCESKEGTGTSLFVSLPVKLSDKVKDVQASGGK